MISATIPAETTRHIEAFYGRRIQRHFSYLTDVRSPTKKVSLNVEWSVITSLHIRFARSAERRTQIVFINNRREAFGACKNLMGLLSAAKFQMPPGRLEEVVTGDQNNEQRESIDTLRSAARLGIVLITSPQGPAYNRAIYDLLDAKTPSIVTIIATSAMMSSVDIGTLHAAFLLGDYKLRLNATEFDGDPMLGRAGRGHPGLYFSNVDDFRLHVKYRITEYPMKLMELVYKFFSAHADHKAKQIPFQMRRDVRWFMDKIFRNFFFLNKNNVFSGGDEKFTN
jgi:hypothetical protein